MALIRALLAAAMVAICAPAYAVEATYFGVTCKINSDTGIVGLGEPVIDGDRLTVSLTYREEERPGEDRYVLKGIKKEIPLRSLGPLKSTIKKKFREFTVECYSAFAEGAASCSPLHERHGNFFGSCKMCGKAPEGRERCFLTSYTITKEK